MIEFYNFASLKKYSTLLHAVTKKSSSHPHSLSLALHTGEKKEDIVHNRKEIAKQLNIDENFHFVVANQTHSDHIKVITKQKQKAGEVWKMP